MQEALQELGEKGERYEDGYIRKDRPGDGGGGALDSEIAAEEVVPCCAPSLVCRSPLPFLVACLSHALVARHGDPGRPGGSSGRSIGAGPHKPRRVRRGGP